MVYIGQYSHSLKAVMIQLPMNTTGLATMNQLLYNAVMIGLPVMSEGVAFA